MDYPFDKIEHIRDYLNGKLSEKEEIAIKQMAEEDSDFQNEIEFTSSLIKELESVEKTRILNLVETNKTTLEKEKYSFYHRFFPKRKDWAIVTGFVFLVISIFLVVYFLAESNDQKDEIKKFIDQNYKSPAVALVDREGEEDINMLKEAKREFELGNYSKSLNLMNTIQPDSTLQLKVILLSTHNHYKLGNHEKVDQLIETFLKTSDTGSFKAMNIENMLWLGILNKLEQWRKTRNEDEFLSLQSKLQKFLSTADSSNTYYEKATNLKELLDQY